MSDGNGNQPFSEQDDLREARERFHAERRALAERALDDFLGDPNAPLRPTKREMFDRVYKQGQRLMASQTGWEPREVREAREAARRAEEIQCARCANTGRVVYDVPVSDPLFGRSQPCPLCFERRKFQQLQRRTAELRAEVAERWPEERDLMALGAAPFDVEYIHECDWIPEESREKAYKKLKRAYNFVRRYAEVWPDGWLTLDGPWGVGKTHLLAMVYCAARAAGKTAIYITGPEFERRILSFAGEHAEEEREQFISDLTAVEVLLPDEWDKMTHKADENGWAERGSFRVLDNRLRLGQAGVAHYHTVLAGNHLGDQPDGLPGLLPAAIQSRASGAGSHWLDMYGIPDARPVFAGDASWKKGLTDGEG